MSKYSNSIGWMPLSLADVNLLIRSMQALSTTSVSSDPGVLKRRDGLTERLRQKAKMLAEPKKGAA